MVGETHGRRTLSVAAAAVGLLASAAGLAPLNGELKWYLDAAACSG